MSGVLKRIHSFTCQHLRAGTEGHDPCPHRAYVLEGERVGEYGRSKE